MEKILTNLQDPSWWFTGIFFVLFGLVLSAFIRYGIPFLSRIFIQIIPGYKTTLKRTVRLKWLRKIRRIRSDDILVIQQIIQENGYFILFLIACLAWSAAYAFVSIPMGDENPYHKWLMLSSLPVYAVEVLWLMQRGFNRRLVRHRAKLRTTSLGIGRS